MAHRRFASRFNSGGPKRQTTWIGPADQAPVAVAANTKVIISSFDPFAQGFAKPTVVRTRGACEVQPQVDGVSITIIGAIGMAVVTDVALAVGVGSLPGPITDAGWDGWYVWRSFGYRMSVTSDIGRLINSFSFEVDSKAMRKVSDQESLVTIVESQAAALAFYDGTRTLLKMA